MEEDRVKAKKLIDNSLVQINKYIIFIAIISQLSIYFTAARIVKTRNSTGISVLSILISTGLSLLWFLNGVYNKNLGSCITTSMAFVGNIIVLFLIYKYRNGPDDDYNFPSQDELNKDLEGSLIRKYHPEIYSSHNNGYIIINSS